MRKLQGSALTRCPGRSFFFAAPKRRHPSALCLEIPRCNSTTTKKKELGAPYEKPPFVHNPFLHWSATNPPVTQASKQGLASSLRPHLHAMRLAEAARSTPATSSVFVKLFGLLHLAVFLCITALQVSDPHPLSAYRRVHDYSMRPSSCEAIKGRQRRRNSWARLPPGVEGWEPWHGYITRSTICNLCDRVKSRLASSRARA